MRIGPVEIDQAGQLGVIAGPCVIENEKTTFEIAEYLRRLGDELGIALVFKGSFDKANRSSIESFRGIGLDAALRLLERVQNDYGLPVLTDVHESTPLDEVAAVVDVLQTPALLCRQTDFIVAVASQGLPVNLKKGQFLSPDEMLNVVAKARSTGNDALLICERGTCFGYHDLVVDMRSLAKLGKSGCPVVFDAGHSAQKPGSLGSSSGGDRSMIPALARAAVAVGVAAVFIETHPDPDTALSDGPSSLPLRELAPLLEQLLELDSVIKQSRDRDTVLPQEAANG